jgi:hypothetical protein
VVRRAVYESLGGFLKELCFALDLAAPGQAGEDGLKFRERHSNFYGTTAFIECIALHPESPAALHPENP